jgi:peptide chain release factor 1
MRRSQIGSGDRNERIRTYNYPQNRVTDHRIGFSAYHLDRYLEGHLDELQSALVVAARQTALAQWDGTV